MKMKSRKYSYYVSALLFLAMIVGMAMPMQAVRAAGPDVLVDNLQPSWTAPGGGGVYAAYVGPPIYGYVSPGATAIYDGREAGIIKAGLTVDPDSGNYEDEGLFGFQPAVTIDVFAAGTLTYDVVTQCGENPVWMTIEIDTGTPLRTDNTSYQYVPTTNPAGWHTVNAAAGQWQKWTTYTSGITDGPLMTLGEVATAHTGLNVVRAYLRLGMGNSYHGTAGLGTVAWVDKATLGGVTYDFVVAPAVPTHVSPPDGSYRTTATQTLIDWSDVTDPSLPVSYIYQSSTSTATNIDGSFTTPAYTSGPLSVSQIATPGTPAGVYYWHVKAIDGAGNSSAWSSYWKITVDNTPPVINRPPVIQSVTANPSQLWPPNNKPVNVKITVAATDPDGAGDIVRTTYSVADEYGKYNVPETNLPSNGIISLIADKNGNDKDGRVYAVTIKVYDAGGLSASSIVNVIVPHDQGKK
jgi:hypothetical protein